MANTHFVIIHGLASKPAKDVLRRRYAKYLDEGVGTEIPPDRIHLAYWADRMGYVPPDGADRDEYVEGGENFRPYSFWEQTKFVAWGVVRSQITQLVEEKLSGCLADPKLHAAGVDSIFSHLPTQLVSAPARRVYERFLPDMHLYFFGDQKEPVRSRLREQLAVVPDSSDVCLIAHSMGSIIAADLILAGTRKIQTFITIGSPLGLRVVKEQIGVSDQAKSSLSSKIGQWFNLYDRLDIVALDNDLVDDYAPMSILDVRVRNEFVNKEGERNHHKSYGYLRSPEMGEIVRELL